MKVYCVNHEDGDMSDLLVSSNIRALISYLIELDVLFEDMDILAINEETNDCEWTTLKSFYGDCWKDTISNLTMDELSDLFFPSGLIFSEKEVIN
jgi:hypothetical protein